MIPCRQRALPWPSPPSPDGLVGAERLTRRLQALKLRSRICRAKPALARWRWRRDNMQSPKSNHRSCRVLLPAPQESGSPNRMKYSPNAIGSPGCNEARHFMKCGPLLPYSESGITVFTKAQLCPTSLTVNFILSPSFRRTPESH